MQLQHLVTPALMALVLEGRWTSPFIEKADDS